jgi:hypothetical protein
MIVRTSETLVDNNSTRQYNQEDSSEHYAYLLIMLYYIHIYYIPWIHKLVRWQQDVEKVIEIQHMYTSTIQNNFKKFHIES